MRRWHWKEITNQKPSALKGLRVIELGILFGAPFCATMMAEFGAEVLMVEDPGTGEAGRSTGQVIDGTSLYFALLARSKRSATRNPGFSSNSGFPISPE
jgi:formyl-CoA transferase